MTGTAASVNVADLTGNGITVSNVQTPTITSATYDSDIGVLAVTGSNLFNKAGANNDIDISTLTLTGGVGNATYTITSSSDVEITSATSFSVTLSGADKTNVDALLDQTGTISNDATTYNLAAAEDWAAGAEAAVNVADLADNGITVTIPPPSSGGGGGGESNSFSKIIDGTVTHTTIQPDSTVVITIPIVSATRQDDPTSLFDDYADIPTVINAEGGYLTDRQFTGWRRFKY